MYQDNVHSYCYISASALAVCCVDLYIFVLVINFATCTVCFEYVV